MTDPAAPTGGLPPPVRPADPLVSLIAPVFNEEAALPRFFAVLEAELAGLRLELVMIDDGSSDGTFAALVDRSRTDPRLRVLKLSRNFGKEAAMTAGLDLCTGDVAIPVDVDLQDPPGIIRDFLARWRDGYDVVCGVRADRSDDTAMKRGAATWFYRGFNRVSDIPIPEHAGDFRLLDRSVVMALRRLPERVRFMKGLFTWVGFRTATVSYRRAARRDGTSKFNGRKLMRFALDGVVSFSSAPLRVWSTVGMLLAIPSFLYMLVIIGKTLLWGVDAPGYASMISVVLFMGGVQMITLGVIGEYVSRMFTEVKGRPVYIVEHLVENGRAQDARP